MDDEERLRRREMIAALREAISATGKDDPEKVQEQRRRALIAYMDAHNLNANGWAVDAGIRPTSLYNFIRG